MTAHTLSAPKNGSIKYVLFWVFMEKTKSLHKKDVLLN